jgi:hypothetical protein
MKNLCRIQKIKKKMIKKIKNKKCLFKGPLKNNFKMLLLKLLYLEIKILNLDKKIKI